ncbi:hypothetical protein BC939DRAFT_437188 [Gamsiella multidivaricata]|uniref:uncharacterized protein n=1 Tax=Gamsiella multidivaricata TaxID=101098 RepID=UPI0022204D2B|nr:uncharacterized protein BC939DRAFT_437188 [Gamsiella multidivaricata]KAG0366223.1 hypothetical protein BGZ54_005657 [Gamsiella multidivaricata]KAI7831477.1 hypothetical protein BC939DRAFT_437188 [Gamsiella multidivaricata]
MLVAPTKPKVLIIGAGLGGLTMAILLEKASIDYEIFERSAAPRALGSATSLTPNVLPLLEQLGLLEGLRQISKKVLGCGIYQEAPEGDLSKVGESNVSEYEAVCGYHSFIMARPDLHTLLLSHVPAHKVHFGKRVLSISQDDDHGVLIRTSDGKTHEGDILIGCDGAYSGVRQSLYKNLAAEGLLPASDGEDMKVCHMSILGTTEHVDPKQIPAVAEELSRCDAIIGYNKPHTWRYFAVPGDRICWRVDVQLDSKTFTHTDAFKNSEWGSEASGSIEDDWRAFRVPIGGTIGDLINLTPQESVSKVMLEEKLYTTWYHSRTVLMGDACHKMLPNAGRGAVNAMLDAVILANAIYEIADDATPENILAAFKGYYKERYAHAKTDLESSQFAARLLAGQSWTDAILRKVLFNFMPTSLQRKTYEKTLSYRPQASFLPKIPNRGTGPVVAQKESKRYEREQAKDA